MKKKKQIDYLKILNYVEVFIIVLSLINLIIYIFKGSFSLMNSDSSFVVEYAKEQLRTGKILPRNWVNTNDFWIYSLIPIITIGLKMGLSFFLSRQIAVFLQTILIGLIYYELFRGEKDKNIVKTILLLVLTGVSGQILFEVFGDATYGTIVFYMMLCLLMFIKFFKTNKKRYAIFLGIVLALITGCSLRFAIYIAAPLIACILYYVYKNGINKNLVFIFMAILIATLMGFLGHEFLSSILILSIGTNHGILSNSEELITSLGNIITNYLQLCGSTKNTVFSLTITRNSLVNSASSPLILIMFIRFVFSILTILMPILLAKKHKNMDDKDRIIWIYACSLTALIFFFLLIGNMSSWYRYITPTIMSLITLYPLFYKYYIINNKDKILFKIIIIVFSLTSLLLGFTSYFNVKEMKLYDNYYSGVTDYLVRHNLKQGFTDNNVEANVYRLLSNNKVQVIKINEDKTPFYWLNSTDWFNKGYYDGKIFYMRRSYNTPMQGENKASKHYTYKDFEIFVFDNQNDFFQKN